MSPVMDAILDDARTFPTADGGLRVECGRACGHFVDLEAPASLGAQLSAGWHVCPKAGQVLAHVLARRGRPVGGGSRA